MASFERRLPYLISKTIDEDQYATRIHSHEHVSLGYIIEGETLITVDNQRYSLEPGDAVLIPSDTPHVCLPVDPEAFRYVMLYIESSWWDGQFPVASGSFRTFAKPMLSGQRELLCSYHDPDTEIDEGAFLGLLTSLVDQIQIDPDDHRVSETIANIHRLICDMPEIDLSLEDYAAKAGVSKYALIRSYARSYGLTPHADKVNMRIQRAILLFSSGLSLTDIAYDCGFSDQSHFIRQFKLYTGMRPQDYRRAILSN